tara:strand:+ start:785 stop:1330 length:546 start_codon:yes stop_codon:yes gene_type:complete
MIENVRLSFANAIWTAKAFSEGQKPKYSCNLLLDKDKDAEQIKSFKAKIKEKAKEAFGEKIPKGLPVCLEDGESKPYDGYENAMFIRAASNMRPQIIDRDRSALVEEDGKPYAGCYVNAAVSLWAMDNKYGKRISCNLTALQFVKDGDRFGDGGINTNEHFKDISKETIADVEDDDDDFLS